jgi:hypothetical protein
VAGVGGGLVAKGGRAGVEACVGADADTWVEVVRCCAEGAGSGVGAGAGLAAGAFCGLGPAACATVTGSTADSATTAAVRLVRRHRAMTDGNRRC